METFIRHWNVVLVGILRYTHSKTANHMIFVAPELKKVQILGKKTH